jgi:hypothetical protein
MSSIGTLPVALGSKMAQNLRRWSARSWMSWTKVPVFLITSSCWKRLYATAKLEDRECSSLVIMYIAYESLSSGLRQIRTKGPGGRPWLLLHVDADHAFQMWKLGSCFEEIIQAGLSECCWIVGLEVVLPDSGISYEIFHCSLGYEEGCSFADG